MLRVTNSYSLMLSYGFLVDMIGLQCLCLIQIITLLDTLCVSMLRFRTLIVCSVSDGLNRVMHRMNFLLRALSLRHPFLNLASMLYFFALNQAKAVPQIGKLGQHSEIFQLNVFLRQVNAKAASFIIQWSFMLPPQYLFAYLTMASEEVVRCNWHWMIKIKAPLQLESKLVLLRHCYQRSLLLRPFVSWVLKNLPYFIGAQMIHWKSWLWIRYCTFLIWLFAKRQLRIGRVQFQLQKSYHSRQVGTPKHFIFFLILGCSYDVLDSSIGILGIW